MDMECSLPKRKQDASRTIDKPVLIGLRKKVFEFFLATQQLSMNRRMMPLSRHRPSGPLHVDVVSDAD